MKGSWLGLMLFPAVAAADRVFTVPIGRKLPYGTIRAELNLPPSDPGHVAYLLGAGLSPQWEIEGRYGPYGAASKRVGTGDVTYNFVGPIAGLSPGISVGVLDVANVTRNGVQIYGALTLRQVAELDTGDSYLDLTVGGSVGKRFSTFFVGASLPLSTKVRILGEHDGRVLSFGAEWRIVPTLGVRGYVRDGVFTVAVQSFLRF